MLWNTSTYKVGNFGHGGRTAQKDLPDSYRLTKAYDQSLRSEPDIVIIMLGTNDAKYALWDETKYHDDYVELIGIYKSLPTNP